MRHENVRFHERQQFRQLWLWAVLFAAALAPLAVVTVATAREGTRAVFPFLLATATLGAIFGLMWFARLDVTVTDRELIAQLWPFHLTPRRYPLSDIREATRRTYSPIMEYGGWGIRARGARDWAYNVSGNEGVQLVFADGKRLLIGSQRAAELEAVLTSSRS